MSPAVAAQSAYDIVKVTTPMTVDGNLSEWGSIPAISIADDPANGRGSLNNSATVKLAWDATYLYAAYNVTDTDLRAAETVRDGVNLFKDDEAELYIDPQGDGATDSSMTATDYHFLANILEVLADKRGDGAGGQDVSFNAPSTSTQTVATGTVNATGTDTGYSLELRIKWSEIGISAPAVGNFMRIDLAVGDRDGEPPPAQVQSFDWANLGNNYNNPSGWKDVQLAGPQTIGIPFGIWGLRHDPLTPGPWTGGVRNSNSHSELMSLLAFARANNLKMWFGMAAGYDEYTTNGAFDLTKWKNTLDNGKADGSTSGHYGPGCTTAVSCYYEHDYLPYIEDGTFQGIVLLDDLAQWAGGVSFSQIEAMAAHAKMRFPALPTAVRERASVLETKSNGAPYTKLDAAWSQYRSDRGTPPNYRDAEIAAAQRVQLGLLLGINLINGGTPYGTNVDNTELLDWGSEFLKPGSSNYVCGFYMYDVTYPNLGSSNMNTLAAKAASHVAAPCKRRP